MNRNGIKYIDVWLKLAFFVSFLLFLLNLIASNLADPDLWGIMSFGRLFWHSETFPYKDVFSYVPTLNPWVYHEWLTGVLFYPLYRTLGGTGLQILKYSLVLGNMALVYLTARKRGAHPLVVALFVVIIFTAARASYSASVRAQVFTFFFFSLYMYILEDARLTGRWRGLYLLPVIQIPWCNLHGGFLAGLGLVAIYALGEFISRRSFWPYLLVFIFSVLATLINPYGVEYWEYMAHAATMPRPFITEWYSIYESYQSGQMTVWLLVYLLILSFIMLFGMWQCRWREVTSSLALAVTLVLGLRHIRHLTFFLILVGAYLPVCFQINVEYVRSRLRLKGFWKSASVKGAALVFLCFFILFNLSLLMEKNAFSFHIPAKLSSEKLLMKDWRPYPVDAVKFIKKQGLSGNILTQFTWGEYLIWELYPQCLVAFDGRYETVYPSEVERKYFEFFYARPQWRQFLEDYPPDLILLKKKRKIVKLLKKEPHWRQIYSDSSSILFVADKK